MIHPRLARLSTFNMVELGHKASRAFLGTEAWWSTVNRSHGIFWYKNLRRLERAFRIRGGRAEGHVLLNLGNRLSRVQTLGACPRAVEDGVAAVEREGVFQLLATLLALGVTRVSHPAVGLHEHRRTEVLVLVPPVRGARSRAASTQNALIQTVQTAAFCRTLEVFSTLRRGAIGLEVWLNAPVLLVELCQVGDQVLDNVHVRQGVNVRVRLLAVNAAKARKRVHTINVHGATATDTLTARAAEGEGGVDFVFNFDQRVEHHGTSLVEVDLVLLHFGLLRRLVGVL